MAHVQVQDGRRQRGAGLTGWRTLAGGVEKRGALSFPATMERLGGNLLRSLLGFLVRHHHGDSGGAICKSDQSRYSIAVHGTVRRTDLATKVALLLTPHEVDLVQPLLDLPVVPLLGGEAVVGTLPQCVHGDGVSIRAFVIIEIAKDVQQ